MLGRGTYVCWALVGVSMAGIAHGANAYKCVDAKGAIAFQQTPCAPGVAQTEVKWRTAPPPAIANGPRGSSEGIDAVRFVVPVGIGVYRPSRPDEPGAIAWPPARPEVPRSSVSQDVQRPATPPAGRRGFECTTDSGRTFYRADECPTTFSMGSTAEAVGVDERVKSREISRAEACDKMGRQSMKFDSVSSYDKRNGKDPCR